MAFIVHLPKQLSYTPQSLRKFEYIDNDDDFLRDPDKFRDILPQPYRMVNELVENIYSDALEIIKRQERIADLERSRIVPDIFLSTFSCNIGVKPISCVCSTNETVFVGVSGGLLAIDACTNQVLTYSENSDIELISIQAVITTTNLTFIGTIDDMGTARLYSFHDRCFSLIRTFSDYELGEKVIAISSILSSNGEFLALTLDSNNQEVHVEVVKLPIDTWKKELESLHPASSQQDISSTDIDKSAENFSNPTPIESHFKFTTPTVVLKLQPPSKLTATQNTLNQALRLADSKSVLGQGYNHLFTQDHLTQRANVFKYTHRRLLNYTSDDRADQNQPPRPHLYFIQQSQSSSSQNGGLNCSTDHVTSLLLWWTDSRMIYQCSLVNLPTKDNEPKPETVMPFCNKIRCTAMSTDSAFLTISLVNGLLILHDCQSGYERGLTDLGKDTHIDAIEFIKPSVCHQSKYDSLSKVSLLVLSDGSNLCRVDFGPKCGAVSVTNLMNSLSDVNSQKITLIKSLPFLPNLVIRIERNGIIYVQNVDTGYIVAELRLPMSHKMASPWDPSLCISAKANTVYISGSCKQRNTATGSPSVATQQTLTSHSNEKSSATCVSSMSETDRLFLFQFKALSCVNQYWDDSRETVPVDLTIQGRVRDAMRNRCKEQAERHTRLQTRWSQLTSELESRLHPIVQPG